MEYFDVSAFDMPRYYGCTILSRGVELSLAERFEKELANFRVLVAENMGEIENRVRYSRLRERKLPFYITIDGCPPEVRDNLEYYSLSLELWIVYLD